MPCVVGIKGLALQIHCGEVCCGTRQPPCAKPVESIPLYPANPTDHDPLTGPQAKGPGEAEVRGATLGGQPFHVWFVGCRACNPDKCDVQEQWCRFVYTASPKCVWGGAQPLCPGCAHFELGGEGGGGWCCECAYRQCLSPSSRMHINPAAASRWWWWWSMAWARVHSCKVVNQYKVG